MVGFDCMPESEFFAPPLTTVVQDFQAVGRTSIELLLRMIDHAGIPVSPSVIPPALVVRASTAAPRPAKGNTSPALREGEDGVRPSR